MEKGNGDRGCNTCAVFPRRPAASPAGPPARPPCHASQPAPLPPFAGPLCTIALLPHLPPPAPRMAPPGHPAHLEHPLAAVGHRAVLKRVLPLHRLHGHLGDVVLGQQLPHLSLHLAKGLLRRGQEQGRMGAAWVGAADKRGARSPHLYRQASPPPTPSQSPHASAAHAPHARAALPALTCSSGISFFLAAGSLAAAASSSAISSLPTGCRGTTNTLRCMPRTTVQHDTCWPLCGTCTDARDGQVEASGAHLIARHACHRRDAQHAAAGPHTGYRAAAGDRERRAAVQPSGLALPNRYTTPGCASSSCASTR